MDQGGVAGALGREADLSVMPKASWVKLLDPFQRVIAAGVAIAGEKAHGTEHAEDGCARGRLQSFTKVAEKSHRAGPEPLVESGKVVRLGCHISFLEQSVLLLL